MNISKSFKKSVKIEIFNKKKILQFSNKNNKKDKKN